MIATIREELDLFFEEYAKTDHIYDINHIKKWLKAGIIDSPRSYLLGTIYGSYCSVYANAIYELYGEDGIKIMETDLADLNSYFLSIIDDVIDPILNEL